MSFADNLDSATAPNRIGRPQNCESKLQSGYNLAGLPASQPVPIQRRPDYRDNRPKAFC